MSEMNRREFLKASAITGAALLTSQVQSQTASLVAQTKAGTARKPIAVASGNGARALEHAMSMLTKGSDALDAVIAGVNMVEGDPNDTSVGYGGLPNEDGVVELDAAVMHGPSYRAGAVGALRNIRNPSAVARTVMERSDHVLLVGEGALRFARAHGFQEENLLTDRAREIWLRWKENLSKEDDWLPPHGIDEDGIGEILRSHRRHLGTIHCSAVDVNGNLSCATSTSGIAFKLPGRVGDSAIIGAGLYCDNEVGAAGSTGRGEANLLNCSSLMIVEWMRQGKTPEEACLLACKRIDQRQRERRLRESKGRFKHNVVFYALNTRGEHGSASIWRGSTYVVHDGSTVKSLDSAYLYEGTPGID